MIVVEGDFADVPEIANARERVMVLGQTVFDERGMIISDIVPTGILPRCLPQLHEHGVDLPPGVYDAAKRGPLPSGHY